MRLRCGLLVSGSVVPLLVLAALPARGGEFAPAVPTPGMAIPLSDPGMANGAAPPVAAPPVPDPPAADPGPGRRRPRGLGSGFSSTDGRLPNQRTGPRREHVVHDICIGC